MDIEICSCCGKPKKPRATGGHMGYSRGAGDNSNSAEFGTDVPHVVGKGQHVNHDTATPLAQAWQGHRYGMQAMKPAIEPIIVFQKPYQGKPVDSITRTGAGAINIDGARIGTADDMNPNDFDDSRRTSPKFNGMYNDGKEGRYLARCGIAPAGRWPANLVLSHAPACNGHCVEGCPVAALGEQSGELQSGGYPVRNGVKDEGVYGAYAGSPTGRAGDMAGSGTAARFFYNADWMAERLEDADPLIYVPKASTAEREAGLADFSPTTVDDGRAVPIDNPYQRGETARRNTHPTIKPISLTRYLATLLLPPAQYGPRRLLVPFSGAGSEMIGADLAGWEDVTGVELETDHVAIANARRAYWQQRRWELGDSARKLTIKAAPKTPKGQIDMFESEAA